MYRERVLYIGLHVHVPGTRVLTLHVTKIDFRPGVSSLRGHLDHLNVCEIKTKQNYNTNLILFLFATRAFQPDTLA